MTTMAIAIISLLAVRLPLASVMSKTSLGITGIWYAMLITYQFMWIDILFKTYSAGKAANTEILQGSPASITRDVNAQIASI